MRAVTPNVAEQVDALVSIYACRVARGAVSLVEYHL
jgi:hypothetical protein